MAAAPCMQVLITAPMPFPHRYVSSLEERLQNFGNESKAKMDAVQKDFDIRAAAAEAEAEKLRRRVADLEAERSQLTHELQHAWDLLMSSPDDVKVSLMASLISPADCLSSSPS